ncbi:MAG: amino acid ABC transporter substrate-binding protein [Methyloceanibacter sp.]|nr:amino acid ABC transporter substrate-binding protein [Methyloceanibacter sp.]
MRAVRLLRAGLAAILLCTLGGASSPGAEDIIILGAAVSLTGKYALNGANTKNGYELAVHKINDKGGVSIGGRSYRFVVRYYDDESTPARGTELAERLVKQDGVKFMLGPYSSGLTKAILPVVEKYKVPMVEGNGAARELFTKGYRYIFAVLSTSDQYLTPAIDLAAEHADKLGKTKETLKVALAMENDPFAQDVRAGVIEDVQRHGMMIVIDDQLPSELNDMSVTLTKVKALKPDVLVISGHEKGALTAISQIKSLQVYVPIIAMTHCDSAQIAEKMGKVAEHAFCAHQWHRSLGYKDELFGTAEDFARAFEAAYAYEAPYQAAQSAAAVHVFADAINRAQSLDPEKVRDAIAATELQHDIRTSVATKS